MHNTNELVDTLERVCHKVLSKYADQSKQITDVRFAQIPPKDRHSHHYNNVSLTIVYDDGTETTNEFHISKGYTNVARGYFVPVNFNKADDIIGQDWFAAYGDSLFYKNIEDQDFNKNLIINITETEHRNKQIFERKFAKEVVYETIETKRTSSAYYSLDVVGRFTPVTDTINFSDPKLPTSIGPDPRSKMPVFYKDTNGNVQLATYEDLVDITGQNIEKVYAAIQSSKITEKWEHCGNVLVSFSNTYKGENGGTNAWKDERKIMHRERTHYKRARCFSRNFHELPEVMKTKLELWAAKLEAN